VRGNRFGLAREPYVSLPRGGATADTISAKLGGVFDLRDIITLAKYEIKLFRYRLNITIAMFATLHVSSVTDGLPLR